MKKKLNLGVFVFLILYMFAACSEDDSNEKLIEVSAGQQLEQTVYADETKGISDIRFTTMGAWTSSITETTIRSLKDSSASENWILISPDSGDKADTYTIAITLTPNYTREARSATITIDCSGDKIEVRVTQTSETATGEAPEENNNVDIYLAGSDGKVAKYWKNGQGISLSDGTNYYASANSIFVAGDDIFVAGRDGNVAKYWKNRQSISLSDGANDAEARSVFVLNGDVYVAGYEGRIAKYWKNGQEVSLSDSTKTASAESIYVSGSDIYVSGYVSGGYMGAVYWKNGQEVSLSNGEIARSVFVSGSDVYIAGDIDGRAAYWKNNQQVILGDGTDLSYAYSIVVSGSDIYVAGEDTGNAVYWKNGKQVILKNDPMEYSSASSIFVLDNDVYVAGGYMGAIYWKNGKQEIVEGLTVNSIFVVKR